MGERYRIKPLFFMEDIFSSKPLAYLKIGIQYVTQAKFSIFMHACLNLVGSITPTDILEHLLVPLVVAALGAPGTIPAPFRVAGVLPSLVQRSWGAAHQPSPG